MEPGILILPNTPSPPSESIILTPKIEDLLSIILLPVLSTPKTRHGDSKGEKSVTMATTISFILEVATRYLDDHVIPTISFILEVAARYLDDHVMPTISFILEVAARYLDDHVMPPVDAVIGSLLSSPDASVKGDDDDSIPDLIPGDQDLEESTGHTNRAATEETRAQTPHVLRRRLPNHRQEASSTEHQNLSTLNGGMHVLLGILLGQLHHPFLLFFAVLGIFAVEHHVTAYDNVLLEQYLASKREPGLLFASRYAPFAVQSQILDRMRRKQSGGRREKSEIRNLSWAMNSTLRDHVERAGGDVVRGAQAQEQAGQNEVSEADVGSTSEIKIETFDEEDEKEEDYVLVEGTARA